MYVEPRSRMTPFNPINLRVSLTRGHVRSNVFSVSMEEGRAAQASLGTQKLSYCCPCSFMFTESLFSVMLKCLFASSLWAFSESPRVSGREKLLVVCARSPAWRMPRQRHTPGLSPDFSLPHLGLPSSVSFLLGRLPGLKAGNQTY